MNYASIRKMDISNGRGVGVSLFVQGCHFHCRNCFNQETWDFNGGKKWTKQVKEKFLNLVDNPHIERVSILGGEPLCDENIVKVFELVKEIKLNYPDKKMWCYTGYTWEEVYQKEENLYDIFRNDTLKMIDVLIDGRYRDDLRDLNLSFRGSSNQRIIDVQNSIVEGKLITHEEWEDKLETT